MGRNIDCFRTEFQKDFQQVMAVQSQYGPPIGMDIADRLKLPGDDLSFLKPGNKNQAVHFSHLVIFFINGADLAGYDEMGLQDVRSTGIRDAVFVL